MKRTLNIIYIICLLIIFKLVIAFFINENFISDYNSGKYDLDSINSLFILNILEPYIAHYNYGNILYKNNNFDGAIDEYYKALKLYPTKERECSIRINLALAMLKKIDYDNEDKEQILQELSEAKKVLCENNCAHEYDDNGHSKEAERLKSDIEKMEEELRGQKTEEKQEDEETEENEQNDKKQEEQMSEKEQQLKEIQKEEEKKDKKI